MDVWGIVDTKLLISLRAKEDQLGLGEQVCVAEPGVLRGPGDRAVDPVLGTHVGEVVEKPDVHCSHAFSPHLKNSGKICM